MCIRSTPDHLQPVPAQPAPSSAQCLAGAHPGNPLGGDWGPHSAGGAGLGSENVEELRGFYPATSTKHPQDMGLSNFSTIFRAFPSQEAQLK